MIAPAVVLGVIWGCVWAAALQWTPMGRFLAQRRTWITVVVGVGVDLLIVGLVVDVATWLTLCGIFAASSVGIIGRSWWNEWDEHRRLLEVYGYADEDAGAEQDRVGS
jgi:hypothetical protein